jgi:hypothetical protein
VRGNTVPVSLLQAIAEVSEEALQRALAHLQAVEFLYETRVVPELTYTFKHALTQEVAYGSLLQERRQALHARLVQTRKERGHEAWTLRLLGEIAAQGEPPDAEQVETHYRQAFVLAKELGMRPLQAHCHHGLGTLYARIGHQKQAQTEWSRARGLYRVMQMTLWLPQLEAALAQVEGC